MNAAYLEQEDFEKDSREESTVRNKNIVNKGYHLYINLDQFMMYVYKDGKLLKTFPVSGGKHSTPSPIGTWRIIRKDTWGEGFGGAWMGFNVPWGLYGIHGTVEPWFIGKSNSSKGCIRMKNSDVKALYKLIPYGTIVTIVHESKAFYPFRNGDVGSDILAIQKALNKLGYYHGSRDGVFGKILKESVQKFQKHNKVYSNGVTTKKTYDLIMQKLKELEGQ